MLYFKRMPNYFPILVFVLRGFLLANCARFNSFIEHCTEEDSEFQICDLVKFLKPFNNRTMRLSGIALAYDSKHRFQSIYLGARTCINRKKDEYLRLLPNALWYLSHNHKATVIVVISPTTGPMTFFMDDEIELDIESPNYHILIINGELKTYGNKRRCVVPVPEMNGITMYHFNVPKPEESPNPSKVHREKLYIGRKHMGRCIREQRVDNFTEINVIKKFENLIPEDIPACYLNCQQTELVIARNFSMRKKDPDAGKYGDLIIYHLNDTHNNNTFVPNVNEMETILYDYEHEAGAPFIGTRDINPGSETRTVKGNRKRSPFHIRVGDKLHSQTDFKGGRVPLTNKLDPLRVKYDDGKKDLNSINPVKSASSEEFEKEHNRLFKRLTLSSMMRLKNAAQPRKNRREIICYAFNEYLTK